VIKFLILLNNKTPAKYIKNENAIKQRYVGNRVGPEQIVFCQNTGYPTFLSDTGYPALIVAEQDIQWRQPDVGYPASMFAEPEHIGYLAQP